MHPLVFPGNRSGTLGMRTGYRYRYTINNRVCTVDEFLQDGDAYVTWEDDKEDSRYGIVKWNHLVPA